MDTSNHQPARRAVMIAALLSFAASIAFLAAFQLSKNDVISAISPFAEDPPDAVASIGFQVALAGGLIALVRWARIQGDPEFLPDRARRVLPGCELVAIAIAATVITDVVAVARSPLPGKSPWELVLIAGLALLGAIGAAAGIATLAALRSLRAQPAPPRDESLPARDTLADLVEDGMVVAGRLGRWVGRRIPAVGLLIERSSHPVHRVWDWLNRSWVSPRYHPWRFAATAALLSGAWLLSAKMLIEGPPSNATVALLVVAIYLGVEMAAVLGGYLLFGGWLGIRPPLRRRRS